MDIVKDRELLNLMQGSGCIGVFLGIESFGSQALKSANKRQNNVNEYKQNIRILHDHGIAVMAGFIAGFTGETPDNIKQMADHLNEVGVDVPFISILTPYKGTLLYEDLLRDKRILNERGWEYFNGYNVAYHPDGMSPDELLQAHRALWRTAFSLSHIMKRMSRLVPPLRLGAYLMSMAMNGFYGYKALRRNIPLDAKDMDLELEIGPDCLPDLEVLEPELVGLERIHTDNTDSMMAQLLL
jgi:radical SAM superfamily enzyme YgiQ (UPF0313 family)